MAATNVIRVRTSVDILQDVGGSAGAQEGITYTQLQHDGNADYRTWGGKYDTLTAYTDGDVCYWKNAVVSAWESYDGLNDSGWTEESDVTDGTLPTTVHVVAVEYVKELGTVGTVEVAITHSGGTAATDRIEIASLDLGESIVIPISAGTTPARIEIKAGAYSDGVNEATVNVMIAGV